MGKIIYSSLYGAVKKRDFTKTICLLNEMCLLWAMEHLSLHPPGSGCEASGGLRASVSLRELLWYFHLGASAGVGFARLIRLADGKTESSEKLFALLPRHPWLHQRVAAVLQGQARRLAGLGRSQGGLLKDVSPYSSVFRRVIPKYRDGTKGVFKASKTFIGQSNSGIKILPLEAVMGSLLCITLPCMFIRWIKIQSRFQMPFALPATASPSSCNWISKTWKVLQRCLRLVVCVVIKMLTVAIQD